MRSWEYCCVHVIYYESSNKLIKKKLLNYDTVCWQLRIIFIPYESFNNILFVLKVKFISKTNKFKNKKIFNKTEHYY